MERGGTGYERTAPKRARGIRIRICRLSFENRQPKMNWFAFIVHWWRCCWALGRKPSARVLARWSCHRLHGKSWGRDDHREECHTSCRWMQDRPRVRLWYIFLFFLNSASNRIPESICSTSISVSSSLHFSAAHEFSSISARNSEPAEKITTLNVTATFCITETWNQHGSSFVNKILLTELTNWLLGVFHIPEKSADLVMIAVDVIELHVAVHELLLFLWVVFEVVHLVFQEVSHRVVEGWNLNMNSSINNSSSTNPIVIQGARNM